MSNANTAVKPKKPRKPIFRANKDQIKQAQKILKDRGFYAGEESGKLDADTRAGLIWSLLARNIGFLGFFGLTAVLALDIVVELFEF